MLRSVLSPRRGIREAVAAVGPSAAMTTLLQHPAIAACSFIGAHPSRGAPSRSVVTRAPTFNGFYISKPEASLNLRVLHPRYAPSSPGSTFVIGARAGRLIIDLSPSSGSSSSGGGNGGFGGGGDAPGRAYDWARKLGFALSASELTQLATATFAAPVRFFHWGAGDDARSGGSGGGGGGGGSATTFSVAPREASVSGGAGASAAFTLTISQLPPGAGAGAEPERSVSIGLSHNDLALLKHLVSQSIVWVTGWQLNLDPTAFHPDVHLAPEGKSWKGSRSSAALPPSGGGHE